MKVKNNIKSKRGFTIIEVVLVLAIAGLIFLMVFVALPALQRNQKDTQRRQDYANLSANITNYMTNNGGKLPAADTKLAADKYINSTGEDPDGLPYKILVKNLSSGTWTTVPKIADETTGSGSTAVKTKVAQVYVITNADCSGSAAGTAGGYSVPKYNASSKAFAVYGYLETGTYCQSNM